MLTIGDYIRQGRRGKNMSISDLEELTHIKKSFLKNIEHNRWKELPEYPVVLGFVKNITSLLDLDQQKALALFRRDYPPEEKNREDKPVAIELKREFRFSPRLVFLLGVVVLALVILGYLFSQYIGFISPPKVEIFEPTQNQIVTKNQLEVIGKTTEDVTIKVNNQPVLVSDDGTFKTTLDIFEGTTDIEIDATSRSGKKTVIHRTIKPSLNE